MNRVGNAADGASLAVLRIGVGLLLALAMARLFWTGWLEALYIAPTYHLAYPGLAWIPVPSPAGIRLLAGFALVAAIAFSLGYLTRWAGALALLAFGWLEAIEVTTYLNHYWLLFSLLLLLTIVPSARVWALQPQEESVRWGHVWSLRAQVLIVYFFAGMAKLHADWLEGLPLRFWLPSRSSVPMVGQLLEQPEVAVVLSWVGLIHDLAIGPLLLWRPSRPWAFGALVAFHLATALVVPSIGLFPWVMILAATVFLEPHWPRRHQAPDPRSSLLRPAPALALVGWLAMQVVLPLRGVVSGEQPRWDGVGYRFAWNVVATDKTGSLAFEVDRVGMTEVIDPSDWFTASQLRIATTEPDLIVQMAQILGDTDPSITAVRADSWASINGRRRARLVDPTVDLLGVETAPVIPHPSLGW